MRIIPYSSDIKPRDEGVIVPKQDSELPYVNYNKHNIIFRKSCYFLIFFQYFGGLETRLPSLNP